LKDPLTRLTERTAALGNYNRKYLHIISTNIDKLMSSLEQHGRRDSVHLWSYSMEIPGEMDTILEIASDTNEQLDFLGCYFALQFLQMNMRMVDIVKLELASGPHRWQTSKRLMLETGRMFRNLTKCYMERLLDLFLEKNNCPEFVMLGVGTRADQDDIDLGIIHKEPGDSESLNLAISRLASQMFKKATRLHFHLSEHVGENSLTATIEQYEETLDKGAYDFVMATEMLGAAAILGSYPLHDEFKARVSNRFYHDAWQKENHFHEGYLRGILSEVRSLLNRMKPPESINPKDDALRPIKSLLSAIKLVHGVHRSNAWNVIDELKEKNAVRLAQYTDLEQALSFFELFRHLYQIIVAQDEDIDLGEPGIETAVAELAGMMGFQNKGVVSAKDFMLVNYYEFLEKSVQAIDTLTGDLKKHLRGVSAFKPIFSGAIYRTPGYMGNLAVDFIRAVKSAKGFTYWDDFLEELSGESSTFYDEFIESFDHLHERVRAKVLRGYVSGTRYDPGSVLRFLVILGERAKSEKAKNVFNALSLLYIDELSRLPGGPISLAHMLHAYPQALNSFLALIEWESLARFVELAHKEPAVPEPYPVHRQLRALTNVHYESSHFFKRHFHQIITKYPTFIRNLHNNDKLREVTNGFFSDLTSIPSLTERIERLGDYYDLEFVRISLLAMSGADCERTDAEFIEFCDNYTHCLYEYCQQDVHLSLGYSLHTRDRFALYATGGHAREQGFDDDYDMIVVLDSTDTDEIDYCNKIIGKMNTHILKRGILPHHRFADEFGSYVIRLDQLAEFLSSGSEDIFVDQSQILSSRMLVGSNKLEQRLQDEIINPLIFARSQEYIGYMREEMNSRHAEGDDQRSNIKECPGGLRDIEMLLLMYEVKHRVRDPLSRKFLRRLVEIEPKHAEDFAHIENHLNFIKNLRDLYRLKVAAHNVIDKDCLPPVAASMGYGESDEASEKLYGDFLERTAEAAGVIDRLVESIRE
jgi:hypothetical protein